MSWLHMAVVRSTNQYRPSLISKESCTHPILPPKGLQAFVAAFGPAPRVCPKLRLHDAQLYFTTRHSSTDPTLRLCAAHRLALSLHKY